MQLVDLSYRRDTGFCSINNRFVSISPSLRAFEHHRVFIPALVILFVLSYGLSQVVLSNFLQYVLVIFLLLKNIDLSTGLQSLLIVRANSCNEALLPKLCFGGNGLICGFGNKLVELQIQGIFLVEGLCFSVVLPLVESLSGLQELVMQDIHPGENVSSLGLDGQINEAVAHLILK